MLFPLIFLPFSPLPLRPPTTDIDLLARAENGKKGRKKKSLFSATIAKNHDGERKNSACMFIPFSLLFLPSFSYFSFHFVAVIIINGGKQMFILTIHAGLHTHNTCHSQLWMSKNQEIGFHRYTISHVRHKPSVLYYFEGKKVALDFCYFT